MNRSFYRISLALVLAVLGVHNASAAGPCVPPGATIAQVRALPGLPGSGDVVSFAFLNRVPMVVVDGILWRQDPGTCQWVYTLKMYDPAYYQNTFHSKNGHWYKQDDSGRLVLLSTEFSDDFESGSTINDLIEWDFSRYTSFVLLSPMAPTVPEYNALRNCILAGTCDFLDNRIDIDPMESHNSNQSLRFYSVAPTPEMITAKSLVERELFYFAKGDTLWFSGWFKAQGKHPFTIVDFNTTGIINRPGLRITIRNGALSAELKWLDKPVYLQDPGTETLFPLDQWVNVRVQVLFSEDEFGQVKIWQDGTKIIDQQGRTLATSDSVIDVIPLGITATQQESVLYVDDVQVSKIPLAPRPPRRRTP